MAEEELVLEEEQKEAECKCPEGAPLWMVTYSDLVTLLLTFFVLLLSMANMDPVKFTAATQSMRDAFGMHKQHSEIEFALPIIPSRPKATFLPINPQRSSKLYNRVKADIETMKLGQSVDAIKKDSDTLILRIQDPILFDSGSAKLHSHCYPLLRKIADIIRPLPADIRIEGHTDDTVWATSPLGNWNLSTERAIAVMRFFKQANLLSLERLSAVGFGSEKPLVPNTTKENRAQNRRVDFILKLKKPQQNPPHAPHDIPL